MDAQYCWGDRWHHHGLGFIATNDGIMATARMTARPIVTVVTVTVGAATTGAAGNSNVTPLLLACGFVVSVKQPV